MRILKFTVKKFEGLNSRASKEIAKKCEQFTSEIYMSCNDERIVNGKKPYGIESLGLHGMHSSVTVTIIIRGSDEDTAYESLQSFFEEEKY